MTRGKLQPTLGLFSSTVIAVSIVIGAGMLVLPGVVFQRVGSGAYWCWVADAALSVPLLWVFVQLGTRYPSAGGVAGFVAALWPSSRIGIGMVLIGTFSLGIPAIALSGSRYLLAGLGVASAPVIDVLVAVALLYSAGIVVLLGARLASRWQNIVVTALLVLLLVLTLATVQRWPSVAGLPASDGFPAIWHGMAMAFFSYTGFEMFSSIAEDMKNPQRDFKRAVLISFALITVLYVGTALSVETSVRLDDPNLEKAPLLQVARSLLGAAPWIGQSLGAVVMAIIFTNLVGAVWAASRMIFDLGRASRFGRRMQLDIVHPATGSPQRAVLFALVTFSIVLVLHAAGVLTVPDMLWLAGQNFLVLYAACVVVFLKVASRRIERMLALLSLGALMLFGTVFSWGLLYPAALFMLPLVSASVAAWLKRRTQLREGGGSV